MSFVFIGGQHDALSDTLQRGKNLIGRFFPLWNSLFRLLRPLLTARPSVTQTHHDAGKRRCLARGQRPDFGRCAQLYGLKAEKQRSTQMTEARLAGRV